MIIEIKPNLAQVDIQSEALKMLDSGVDTGDSLVLDEALRIAFVNKLDIQFKLPNGNVIDLNMAWRLRNERGFDLRYPSEKVL